MANEPIVNLPSLYLNGMQVAWVSGTTLSVSAGQCRDSTNVYDITLAAPLTLNMAVDGANGLDTGSIGASKIYYIYVIADALGFNAPAVMASLSATPLMPYGYSIMRVVGYMVSSGASAFLLGYWSGYNNDRLWTYDAPLATSVTAGISATYAAIDLSNKVPAVDQLPVLFQINWTANAAADTFNMQGANSTGDAVLVIAPLAGATAHTVVNDLQVLSQLATAVPTVNYKVSAVGGVAINIQGYKVSL